MDTPTDGDRTKRPYPSVRRIFVEPYQRPIEGNSRKCSSLRAQHGYYVRRLEKLKVALLGAVKCYGYVSTIAIRLEWGKLMWSRFGGVIDEVAFESALFDVFVVGRVF